MNRVASSQIKPDQDAIVGEVEVAAPPEQVFRALTVSDLTPKLPAYKLPTLIVNGEHDNARPGGTRTAALIPHAEHKILPATGHCCFLEDPGGFEALLRDFLQRNHLWPQASL